MSTHIESVTGFVRQFENPVIAGFLAADHERRQLGDWFADLTEIVRGRSPASRRRSARAGGRVTLHEWAGAKGLSAALVCEAYVDYWFLYTVLDPFGRSLVPGGVSLRGFLSQMNSHLTNLSGLCPGIVPPEVAMIPRPGGKWWLTLRTPRHLPEGLVPGFVRRAADVFLENVRALPVAPAGLPCWELRG